MATITVQIPAVNVELLDEEIRESVGAAGLGISWNGSEVTVYLVESATPEQISAVQRLIQQHDPLRLTPAQQEAADRAARLEALRAQNAPPLDLSVYEAAEPEILRLAEKIAWLELVIAARR